MYYGTVLNVVEFRVLLRYFVTALDNEKEDRAWDGLPLVTQFLLV